uniref:Chromo domain-containing protein n=1 Tax=Panagrolaimus superbus TaxID=310955 RepID=A0A914Z2B8_9BILA
MILIKNRNDKKDDIDKKTNELEIKGEDEEDVFGVDYIVEHRKASEINFVEWNQAWNGSMDELAFLVKWTGFDSTENTWEPLENVLTCVKFEQYLNKFLVPTIGRTLRKGRGRRENVSFEFIEPKVNQCYYLKDLQVSNVNCVGHDDSDVHDHDFVPTPPPKKAKYSAIRSPKVVAKPKKTKQDVESNAASYALHNLLNGENFVFDEGNAVSENIVADETADFFGGAPDVDDLLTEPHVFEADVILGNFDTPRGRPTKNVPQPTTRVTRSRTFAASSTAPENDVVVNTNSLGSYSNDQQQTYPVPLQNDFDYSFNNNIIPPSTSSKIDPNPRTSFSNDPMLMGNYEDLYSDNRYVPPISDGFKNVEENEKQNFDGNFLASENLEEDLSIHFNFNGSSSNNAGFNSIMNPYYQQQNITNETELFDLETTYDNPFNLFGFENASALLEPSIGYIEDFMDVVQEDII